MAAGTKGKIVQVLGAVVDIEFPPEQIPEIYNEVLTRVPGAKQDLALEVEQLLGNNWVRCVAMGPTDGLQRGLEATDTGAPISVPVGEQTLGRIFNVLGQAIDNKPDVPDAPHLPIHRQRAGPGRPGHQHRGLRDRPESYRPDRPFHERR